MDTVVTRVRVYFNLHKRMFSVQRKTEKGWRLWCHTDFMFLKNVRFVVSEYGRQKVLRERKKNVHAFVEGDIGQSGDYFTPWAKQYEIWYNPYFSDKFMRTEFEDVGEFNYPVEEAKYVSLQRNSQRKARIYCEL